MSLCVNAHKGVGTWEGQRASNSLQLELQVVLRCLTSVLVLWKSHDTLDHWTISMAPFRFKERGKSLI